MLRHLAVLTTILLSLSAHAAPSLTIDRSGQAWIDHLPIGVPIGTHVDVCDLAMKPPCLYAPNGNTDRVTVHAVRLKGSEVLWLSTIEGNVPFDTLSRPDGDWTDVFADVLIVRATVVGETIVVRDGRTRQERARIDVPPGATFTATEPAPHRARL
ncbi:hypothetical protein [Burkholderia sp. LMG 13014]|uniref:hypothetical protein n=1 Tax=Burkholderia sp. LMG 13014 TaxID=2709306 RepID=UPI00196560C9|nr:hypothetical protein [Burkholderia sp. LMG 13014]